MKSKAYIGVTGFKTPDELRGVAKIFEDNGFPTSDYTAMFGFIASKNGLNNPDVEGRVRPALNNLSGLISSAPDFGVPMLHYFTPTQETLAEEVIETFSKTNLYDSGKCRAVQLNSSWPSLLSLEEIKSALPDLEILLQLPKRATENFSLAEIGDRAGLYDGLVNYALVDPSGGKGVPFDLDYCTSLLSKLESVMPNTRVGIAGGLSGDNVYSRMMQIQNTLDHPFLIDAEGRLRNKSGLDLSEVKSYVQEAKRAL